MPRMKAPALLILACALALTACGSGDSSSDTSARSSSGTASGPTPTIRFVKPDPGAGLSDPVRVRVALTHFQLAPQAVGQAPRPNQGHLHFKMDGGKFDFPKYSGPNGLIAKKLGVTGHYSPALTPTITYRHLPRGRHKLEVYLANNNHTNVGIEKTVKFTVR
jgi:hypothetical protein